VESFRSTLAEVADADLVLHVVDGAAADPEGQIAAVHAVMAEIDADALPEMIVVNKVDTADPDVVADLVARHPGAVAVSGRRGDGIDALLAAIGARLRAMVPVYELLIPYDRGELMAALHREGEVLVEVHGEAGTRVRARLPDALASRVGAYVVA
jgi:GTP-binding protein HflX